MEEISAAGEASSDALDHCRLSKQGWAVLFAARKKTLSEGEVKELILRIDTSGDGRSTGMNLGHWYPAAQISRFCSNHSLALVLAFGFPRKGLSGASVEPLAFRGKV